MVKNAEETKIYILRTALGLFMEKGYKDTSYQDLMQRTGLSKGAIYHHFTSKDEILNAVFIYMYDAANKGIEALPQIQVKDEASFIKAYMGIVRTQMKGFREFMGVKKINFNRMLFYLEAINENKMLKKTTAELYKYQLGFLVHLFEGMKKNGKLDKAPRLMAESLSFYLEGMGMIAMCTSDIDTEEEWMKLYEKALKDFFKTIA